MRCVLATTRRLVLRYNQAPSEPSGPTDPRLYVLAPDGTTVVTTDADRYALPDGRSWPVTGPEGAAEAIARRHLALRP